MDCSILKKFADKYHLNISRDDCGDLIIRGKNGQVYEYGKSLLGVMFMPVERHARLWGTHRGSALGLEMTLLQNGDGEGCFAFDPENNEQAKLALKVARIKRRRELSSGRKAQLRAYLELARNSRFNSSVEGHSSI